MSYHSEQSVHYADPDPDQFEKQNSDAASKSKQATDSHQSEKPDPNLHQVKIQEL
jgi:hypothetical protein